MTIIHRLTKKLPSKTKIITEFNNGVLCKKTIIKKNGTEIVGDLAKSEVIITPSKANYSFILCKGKDGSTYTTIVPTNKKCKLASNGLDSSKCHTLLEEETYNTSDAYMSGTRVSRLRENGQVYLHSVRKSDGTVVEKYSGKVSLLTPEKDYKIALSKNGHTLRKT